MNVMEEKKFKFEKKNDKLEIKVKGFFKEEDGVEYIKEYSKQVRGLNALNTELILDCTELSVTKQDLMPMLTACFNSYKKDRFKKVTTIVKEKNQATLVMQLNTLATKTKLENFDLIKIK